AVLGPGAHGPDPCHLASRKARRAARGHRDRSDPARPSLTNGYQSGPSRGACRARVRPPPPAHVQRGRGRAARADHGRGLGPTLVRADEDPRRPYLMASEEARGRPLEPQVHHDRPRGRISLRRERGPRDQGVGVATKVRSRLVLAFAYILVTVIVALEAPLVFNLQRRVRAEATGSAENETLLIAADIGAERTTRLEALQKYVQTHYPASTEDGRVIVVDPDGVLIADSLGPDNLGTVYATPKRPELVSVLQNQRPYSQIRHSVTLGEDILVSAAPILDEGRFYGVVRLTQAMGRVQERVRAVVLGLVVIGVAALAAGLIIAFALAGSLSRPLAKLAAAAQRLGTGDLTARADTSQGATEIRVLAESFDEMADRLEDTVKAQREFVANASHQLRTPLTGMKLRLESAIEQATSGDLRRQLEAADQEVDRLAEIVQRLLLMARRIERGGPGEVDLSDAV